MTLRALLPVRALVAAIAIAMVAVLVVPLSATSAAAVAATVTGTVFRDFNHDGDQDGSGTNLLAEPGIAGVEVIAYDAAGTKFGPATTNAAGLYSLSVPTASTTALRVEVIAPAGAEDSRVGTGNASTIRFVTISEGGTLANQHFALAYPDDYCQANPSLCTSLFPWNGATTPDLTGLVTTPYSATEVRNDTTAPTEIADGTLVGPVFGIAYDPVTQSIFSSAYLRRKAPFANDNTSIIYRRTSAGTVTAYADLSTIFYGGVNNAASAGGVNPHPQASTTWINDTSTADLIGKRGLGDLDISRDGKFLYTVGLNDKKLYIVPTTATPTSANVARLDIFTAAIGNCPTSDIQPFGIGVSPAGRVLIGGVCSAATSGNANDLKFYIWELNAAGTAVSLVTTLDVDNTVTLPGSNLTDAPNAALIPRWNTWATWNENWALSNRNTDATVGANEGKEVFPQPMLSDIEFDGNDLILGVRDRYGDQIPGEGRPTSPTSGSNGTGANPWPRGLGDVLRVCSVSGSFVMEGNGVSGCNSGTAGSGYSAEWFAQDQASDWWKEQSAGGIAVLASKPGVLSTAYDPRSFTAGGAEVGGVYDENGIVNLSKTDSTDGSAHIGATRIYADNGNAARSWGKANGLGDLEALCDAAPLEVGNRVWEDLDRDGIQDPGEPGLDGVAVRLYAASDTSFTTILGTAITSGGGQYYFTTETTRANVSATDNIGGGLTFRNGFVVRLDRASDYTSALDDLELTTSNAVLGVEGYTGQSDFIDSDPTAGSGAIGSAWFPAITISADATNPGENDHTLDFGFAEPIPPAARDLALSKTVVSMNGTPASGTVTFQIEIFNQTADSVEDVTITDYIDTASFAPMTVLPAGGNTAGGAVLPYTWNNASTTAPTVTIDGVIPGNSSVTLNVTLTIANPVRMAGLQNWAEITRFDVDGNSANGDSTTGHVYDIDSIPDAVNTDTLTDDVINLQRWTNTASSSTENGAVTDEDDHDIAVVPVYDLALIKTRAAGQPAVVINGATTATFDITVKNQGQNTAHGITVLDSPVSPLTRSATTQASQSVTTSPSNTSVTVTYNSGTGTFTIPQLAPGESVTFQIITDLALTNAVQINRAEITAFDNDANNANVKPTWVQDMDSTPDTNPANDALQANGTVFPIDSHNVIDNAPVNGTNALDEDDHDSEGVQVGLLRIGSTVYKDANDNNVGDTGEEVAGVRVQLFRWNGTAWVLQGTTNTNAGGDYSFDQLAPGTYQVGIPSDQSLATAPTTLVEWEPVAGSVANPETSNFDNDGDAEAGFISRSDDIVLTYDGEPTNDTADTADADALTSPRTYTNVNSNLNIDFVFEQITYEIGNLVWLDNGAGGNYNNGIANSDESGIAGVLVELYTDATLTTLVDSDTTNANGFYTFTDLLAGDYVVHIPSGELPNGYVAAGTPVTANGNDTDNDNNAVTASSGWSSGLVVVGPVATPEPTGETDGTTGATAQPAASVADNRANQTVDFGFVPTVRIGNQVWRDQSDNDPQTEVSTDNNGVFDSGELGLAGVTVQLWRDINANSTFERAGADGMAPLQTTTTDSEGNYWFEGVRPGVAYFVVIPSIGSLAGANPASSTGQSASVVAADNDDDGAPVGSDLAVSRVFTPALGGASTAEADAVEPGDGAGTTDADAEIEANLAGTTYDDNDSELRVDFGFIDVPVYRVGNLVWNDNGGSPYVLSDEGNGIADPNEPGIAGVEVQLFAAADTGFVTPLATATTDANGEYAFENLVAGNYVVRISSIAAANVTALAGLVSTVDGSDANTDTDNDDNGVDFPNAWVSSTVTLGAANAYLGAEPLNESRRDGESTDYDDGASWTASPLDPPFYANSRSNLTVDFGFMPLYRLGNLVWLDADNDGLAESGEPALSGVTVELWRDAVGTGVLIGDTVTNAQGFYSFEGLRAGDYVVHLPGAGLPTGVLPGGTAVSANNDVDNDNNAVDDLVNGGYSSGIVTLGNAAEPTNEVARVSGADDDTTGYADNRSNYSVDFGFWPQLRLGNLVWHDESDADPATTVATDNNGVVDAGESVMPGVTVQLWRDGGNGVFDGATGPGADDFYLGNDTTDAEGNYQFDHLAPGDYFVAIQALPVVYAVLTASTPTGTDDNDNHGDPATNGDASVTYASVSSLIELAAGTAPTGEADTLPAADGSAETEANATSGQTFRDSDSDLTIDFGFVGSAQARDLALRKTVVSMNGTPGSGTVTFLIEIFNQGTADVEDIWVTDYIDLDSFGPMTVVNASGDTDGDVELPYSWDNSDTENPVAFIEGVLPAGESFTFPVTLTIAQPVRVEGLRNWAEISRFDNDGDSSNGDSSTGHVYDVDSIPDGTNTDTLTDDEIDEQRWTNVGGTQTEDTDATDEDDHDIAELPVYDLALIKTRSSGQDAYLTTPVPAAVSFDITVKNQGEFAAHHIVVKDSVGTGLELSGANATATVSGHLVTYSAAEGTFTIDTLAPGESLTFPVLVNATVLTNDVLVNTAEIESFDNDADVNNAVPSWVQDLDSTPDANPFNDIIALSGVVFDIDSHNNVDNAPINGTNPADEDDHDSEGVTFALMRIGSTVYIDANGNDIGDVGEGVAGVLVQLLDDDDNVIAETVTNADGDYSFDQLFPGTYRVGIPTPQSHGTLVVDGSVLVEHEPVPGAVANPEASNFDNDGDAETGWLSLSDDVVLALGTEPAEDAGDKSRADILTTPRTYATGDSNLNIDFVFELVTYELGNLVWLDNGAGANYNNGEADSDESGIDGVDVHLYRDNGAGAGVADDGILHPDELIDSTTTVGGGSYTFTDLIAADDYVVYIPTTSLPLGYGTSGIPVHVEDEATPHIDNNNNAVNYSTTGWSSGPVALGPVAVPAPTGEVDGTTGAVAQPTPLVADNRANQTVDFGFIPSLRIGNQVWRDESDTDPTTQASTDNNGVFDAASGEVGLTGVFVELWIDVDTSDGAFNPAVDTLIDDAVTNTEGNYWFTGVRPDLTYFVVVVDVGALAGANPASSAGQSTDPLAADNDDDGAPVAGYISVSNPFTPTLGNAALLEADAVEPGDGTGLSPDANAEAEANDLGPDYDDNDSHLRIDFGFVNVPVYRLGNLVWLDNGGSTYVAANENNGIADATEPGIPGVVVELYADNDATAGPSVGDTYLGFATTDADGKYAFENLASGDYWVRIDSGDNASPLAGLASTVDGATANADVDNDDNGVLASGGWASSVVSLNAANAYMGGEPTNEVLRFGDTTDDDNGLSWTATTADPAGYHDNRSNFSIDFGFSPLYRLGNLVWFDADNDGIAQTGETGLAAVEVELFRDTGDGVPQSGEFVSSTVTDGNGYYSFTNLPAGNYIVVLPGAGIPAGFLPGGTPVAAGTGLTADVDNDNNANPFGASYSSGVVVLGGSAEPIDEQLRSDDSTDDDNDSFADNRSDRSVDFGFWPGLRLGNLVWHDESDTDPTTVELTDNNGEVEPFEAVMVGVEVELWIDLDDDGIFEPTGHDSAQTPLTDTTDSEGNYLFTGLVPGSYFVAIQSLPVAYQGFVASGPRAAADNTNKGAAAAGYVSVSALQVVLTTGGALTGESDVIPAADGSAETEANTSTGVSVRDVDSFLQHDFGFVEPPAYRIGNLVWRDDNRNGIADSGEPGINGVLVQLLDSSGDVVAETLTAGVGAQAGKYEFTETDSSLGNEPLAAGTYRVRIPKDQTASEFGVIATAGALSGLASTTDLVDTNGVNDSNPDDDNNDDGVDSTNFWTSPVITLGPGQSEPTDETLRYLSGGDDDAGWTGGTDAQSNFTVDFGFYPGLRLGDTVWFDDGYNTGTSSYNYANENNGVFDAGERPAADVTVQLFADSGVAGTFEPGVDDVVLVQSTTTDADGNYFFVGLDEDIDYWVVIPDSEQGAGQELFGWSSSDGQAANGNGTNDRDHGAPASGYAAVSPLVDLTRGAMAYGDAADEATADTKTATSIPDANSNLVIDFGFVPEPRYELGNLVWLDNDNGIVESGELGIGGVTVQLYANDGAVDGVFDGTNTQVGADTVTDGDGRYSFSDLPAGEYFVFIPDQSALAHLDLSLGRFDNVNPSLLAHDNDNNGHPVTDILGALTGWVSSVTELGDGADNHSEPAGETDANTGNSAEDSPDSPPRDDRSDQTIDFGFSERLRLGNLVWRDEADADPATEVATDNDGRYNPAAGEVPLVGVAVELWHDTDGDGFQGADGTDDILLQSDTTDSNGHYLFTRLVPGGDYYVAIPSVGSATPAFGTSGARSSAGQSTTAESTDNDDDGASIGTYSSVSTEITLTLNPDEATGEADGFGATTDGSAEIAANVATGVTYLDINSQLQVDFGFVNVPLYRVGNLVWYDANADGIADSSEPAIEGVRVDLYSDVDSSGGPSVGDLWLGSDNTDAAGKYAFENLVAGDYYVVIPDNQSSAAVPTALSNLLNTAGQSDADIDADNTDDGAPLSGASVPVDGVYSTVFTLGAGVDDAIGTEPTNELLRAGSATDDDTGWTEGPDNRSNFSVDFGFYQQLRLGNLVWLDDGNVTAGYDPSLENNGIADPGETGINGVTVALFASDGLNGFDPGVGDTFISTVDTQTIGGVDGVYSFDNLDAGEYYVALVGDEGVFTGLRLATNPAGTTESADDDNDGEATAASGYSWVSGPVALTYGGEPTDENGDFLDGTSGAAEAALNAFYDAANGAAPYVRSDNFSQLRVDFGFSPSPLYSLGNLVWEDWNNNGAVDTDEPGIFGVTVELYAASDVDFDTVLDTDVTDGSGQYQFTDLPAGDYVVRIAQPGASDVLYGWYVGGTPDADANNDEDNDNNAVPDAGNGGWTTGPVTLGEGDDHSEPVDERDVNTWNLAPTDPRDDRANQTVDFGFWRGLRLGNQVWLDEGAADHQNNGVYDADETPIAGVSVELWLDDSDGVFDPDLDTMVGDPQVTDIDGRYYFEGVDEGDFFVAILSVPGNGVQSSTDTSPSGLAYDSEDDGDPASTYLSVSPLYTLTVGGAEEDEVDGPAVGGGLAEGNANNRTLDAAFYPDDNSFLTVDFGFINVPLYRVGNLVWNDYNNDGLAQSSEPGIAGVLVQLYQGTTLVGSTNTDANGYYEFENLIQGDYQVVIPTDQSSATAPAALEGFLASTAAVANANNDQDNDSNANLGTVGTVDGFASGVVRLGPETAGGDPDVEPENEQVRDNDATDDDAGQAFSAGPPSQARIDDDRSNFSVDFGFYSINLGNLVFFDADGDGIYETGDGDVGLDAVDVNLYRFDSGSSAWVLADSTQTDASGLYLFTGLVDGGEYYVEIPSSQFVGAGALVGLYSSVGDHGDIEAVTVDNRDRGVDPAALYGAVRSNGAVTVTATGEPTGENPDNNPAVTPDVASNLTVDFGFYAMELGGVIWQDNGGTGPGEWMMRNNGIYDRAYETPFENVTLVLWEADGTTPFLRANGTQATTTTDANGDYRFTGLPAGEYVVSVPGTNFAAAGVLEGFANSDGNDTAAVPPAPAANTDDVDADNGYPESGDIFSGDTVSATVLTLEVAGEPTTDPAPSSSYLHTQSNLTVDFGFWNASVELELGNQIWFDENRDGIYDIGLETPAPAGIVVQLMNADTQEIIATTLTDANGQYLFTGLDSGRYRVGLAASNFQFGGPLYFYTATTGPGVSNDPDDELDSDSNGLTLPDFSVWSEVVTLIAAAPMFEDDPASVGLDDRMSNLTVDFGLVRSSEFADTGFAGSNLLAAALALMSVGVFLVVIRRRKREA
jgi:protocatechuate 3,4-dioxygenase beta subunit